MQGRNALEVFDDLHGVMVVTKPMWSTHGLWVPYRARREDVQAALATPWPDGPVVHGVRPNTLFIHHGVQGAFQNNAMVDTDGLPLDMFAPFKHVLCGHYHKRQTLGGKVHYVGSPWQTKADEAGQSKGYAIWDGKRLEYVDTQWGPRHYKLIVESPEQVIDTSFMRPQDKLKVEIRHAGVDTGALASRLAAVGIAPVIEHNIEHQHELRLGTANSLEEYAGRYVSAFATERALEPARLMSVFQKITQ